ncbi:malto-oligosyltrehalose trehalohydrolase [Agrobacterium tumefaciens]|uniref:malto-oligosyltrehalose trehalohydrolase n=1 Tax=Agrobacterium tumefaciens TaxID=358 RepID=UPI00384FAB20
MRVKQDNRSHSTSLWEWGPRRSPSGGVTFRTWAPGHSHLYLDDGQALRPMKRDRGGWFEITSDDATAGTEYFFVTTDGTRVPDPASRAQKDDVNGPSVVTDPDRYTWRNVEWVGRPWEEAVIYEMHVGTFTVEGTFNAAVGKLSHLAQLGITMIEVMPVSHFGGNHGWGYDGSLLYAPHTAYGAPDDFKAFIDEAHGHGISVVLDIVLNHFGPEGNYLSLLAPSFFDKDRKTPWGDGIAYDVDAVRRYIVDAPLYWLHEFHLDGLRFDAIDQIEDNSAKHILVEIAERIRREITDRPIHLTTEDSRNIVSLHQRVQDGGVPLFTAEWNDDFHNAVHALVTGESGAYYQDFAVQPEKLVAKALAEGFAYQGETSPQTGKPRGVRSNGQPCVAFVDFIQNHDQVGNRAHGERLVTLIGGDRAKVLMALLLLSPHIPLLFMGEEFGESNPFLFFTDFRGDLGKAVRDGRKSEFDGHSGHECETVPDPNDCTTFEASKLDWSKAKTETGEGWLALTRKLLLLRQTKIVPLLRGDNGHAGRVVEAGDGCVAVTWTFSAGALSIAVNLGDETRPLPDQPGDAIFAWPKTNDTLPKNSILVRLTTETV